MDTLSPSYPLHKHSARLMTREIEAVRDANFRFDAFASLVAETIWTPFDRRHEHAEFWDHTRRLLTPPDEMLYDLSVMLCDLQADNSARLALSTPYLVEQVCKGNLCAPGSLAEYSASRFIDLMRSITGGTTKEDYRQLTAQAGVAIRAHFRVGRYWREKMLELVKEHAPVFAGPEAPAPTTAVDADT